jgi:hypothetical protein
MLLYQHRLKKLSQKVPAAEAMLVLVECNLKEALLYLPEWKHEEGILSLFNAEKVHPSAVRKAYKPILISETEKIEIGDSVLCFYPDGTSVIRKIISETDTVWMDDKGTGWFKDTAIFKILALPEQFSPKYLQAIVDGKLKDGDKVLVELNHRNEIKLEGRGGERKITLHKTSANLTMKHLFVPYEIALKLKEKGFDEPCLYHWERGNGDMEEAGKNEKWGLFTAGSENWLRQSQLMPQYFDERGNICGEFSAPLYQQVIDWLKTQNPKVVLLEHFDGYWDVWYARGTNSTAYTAVGGHFDLNGAIEEALKLI